MNVFFMLLTTVSAADPGPVVAHPAPSYSGHCGAVADCCCQPCCMSKREQRKAERECKKQCKKCCKQSCCQPCCDSCCDSCCMSKREQRKAERECKKQCKKCCKKSCCCPAPCDSCHDGHHDGHYAPAHPVTPGTIITPTVPTKPAETIKKMPKDEGKTGAMLAPLSTVTPTAVKIETESKNPFELARRYETRVSRATDYSKLTGRLFYVHADGGLWVLRYAPLSEEDAHGGSVVLSRDRLMNSYREGDLVTVEGQVISEKGSSRLGGALFQVRAISLVDRPAR